MGIDVAGMLERVLIDAKKERAGFKYSEDEKMMNTCIVIGPDDELTFFAMNWRDSREKQIKMAALAAAAKQTRSQAVILISDTRWLKGDIFGLHFGLPTIEEIGAAEFQKRYHAILSEKYEGQIKNLPRELWNEAVLVAIKGPHIKTTMRMAHYCQGPNDEVVFSKDSTDEFENGETFMSVIPDWWTR